MPDHAEGKHAKTSQCQCKLYDPFFMGHFELCFMLQQVQRLTSILHSDAGIETTLPKQSDV